MGTWCSSQTPRRGTASARDCGGPHPRPPSRAPGGCNSPPAPGTRPPPGRPPPAPPPITSVLPGVNPGPSAGLPLTAVAVIAGRPYIMEELAGLRFRIGLETFFQTNTTQAERMIEVVETLAEVGEGETVY